MSAGPGIGNSATPRSSGLRLPAPARFFGRFLLSIAFFFLARAIAERGARGLVLEDWAPLAEQAMLAFLLLFGYAGFGFLLDGELHPIAKQGLPARSGWLGEAGLGLAFGWGIVVLCLIPIMLAGGLRLHFSLSAASFVWLMADTAYFAILALATEIAFRGYPLQSAIRAVGEFPAVLMLAALYGIANAWLPGASRLSMAVTIALGLLLSMAYLRTRALWLPWGLQFGWIASRALLFGLPIRGVTSHSPVVQGDPIGYSLSGGDFGLDGSWLALLAILLAMPFLYRATRDLSFHYNAPVLEPGGIPVDLDSAARSQHDAATRESLPEVKPLVQILPAASPIPRPAPGLGSNFEDRPTAAAVHEAVRHPDLTPDPGPFDE